MSKFLFILNQGLSPLHLGICLEVLEQYSDSKDQAIIATCDKRTSSCFFNPTGNPLACAICEARSQKQLKMLDKANLEIETYPNVSKAEIEASLPHLPLNPEEIDNLHILGVPVGRGILSSVISLKRDYDLNTEMMHRIIEEELLTATKALLSFNKLVALHHPDEVYIFNGRFSECRPMINYCEINGIPYKTVERGSSTQKFMVFENSLPHSPANNRRQMFALWGTGEKAKQEIGKQWFLDKIKGINKDDTIYINHQEETLLPENFNDSTINIAIFNSSEDEFKALEEWQTPLFKHQNDAIREICSQFVEDNTYRFYLRVHPNLKDVDNSQTREIAQMEYHNLTIIPADSRVSTYGLLNACDMVITFGSTIGIEATFHGKPSILVGTSFYKNMQATYEPATYEEIYDLVKKGKNLPPLPKESTLPYGYYISQRGMPYQHFSYHSKNKAWYKGKKIRRFYPLTFWYLLKYLKDIPLWRKKFEVLYGRKPSSMDLKHLKLK